jgi:hypothetical protein
MKSGETYKNRKNTKSRNDREHYLNLLGKVTLLQVGLWPIGGVEV